MTSQFCPQPHLLEDLEASFESKAACKEGGGNGENNNNNNKENSNGNSNSDQNQEARKKQQKIEEEEAFQPCGQYGFRCLDKKRFQICPGPPLDDGYLEKEEPEEHTCGEGLVCDEDNPAYCTPLDNSLTTMKVKDCGPLSKLNEDEYFNDYLDKVQKLSEYNYDYNQRIVRSLDKEESEEDVKKRECTPCSPTTTETTAPAPTTMKPSPDPNSDTATTPIFDCEGYGFKADTQNNTLFWYCDVPESGVGYIVKHMSCGEDRIFDSSLNTCVKIGTTRNIRNNVFAPDESVVEMRCAPPTPPPAQPFSCKNFPPGKYKDDNDCSLYHICFSNKYFPLKEVTLSCPHNMIFDAFMKKCTHKNAKRCPKPTQCTHSTPCQKPTTTKCPKSKRPTTRKSTTTKTTCSSSTCSSSTCSSTTEEFTTSSCSSSTSSPSPINCETPIRFRDVSDCSGYFLCYSDNVIHMNCPESFKFDDSYHDCMPDRMAHCTEEI